MTGSNGDTKVRTARRSTGGVAMIDMSRTPDKASCKRARDRRRGERQHMHFGAQLLELFLMRDAEMLLLVDHDQSEILELDRFAKERMGADDDVDGALGDAFFDRSEFFGRD